MTSKREENLKIANRLNSHTINKEKCIQIQLVNHLQEIKDSVYQKFFIFKP